MDQFIIQATAIAAGVAALHIFFRSVEVRWPQFYFSASDTFAQAVSVSPWRYLAFRAIPVVATTFFVSAALRQANFAFFWSPLAIAAVHAAGTNGRAFVVGIAHSRGSFGFWPIATQHLIAFGTCLLAGFGGSVFARQDWALSLIPSADEIADSLWTAIIAAILGAYVMRMANGRGTDVNELFLRSRRSIDDTLWRASFEFAASTNTDPLLVQSIMLVENLQRPRWFRRTERFLAHLGHRGTYGIMQVRDRRAVDDVESVRIACEAHLRGAAARYDRGFPDRDSIHEVVRPHNDDDAFLDMVWRAYYHLWQRSSSEFPI